MQTTLGILYNCFRSSVRADSHMWQYDCLDGLRVDIPDVGMFRCWIHILVFFLVTWPVRMTLDETEIGNFRHLHTVAGVSTSADTLSKDTDLLDGLPIGE